MSDLLASATLAKLYVEQGHFARAREIVDTVLAQEPFDPLACAYRERLRTRSHAGVKLHVEADALAVKWRRVPGARLAGLFVHVFAAGERIPVVTRARCEKPNSTFRLARPRRGSAVAVIRTGLEDDAPILAVSTHLTW